MGFTFMADGRTDAPAGADPPASLPLPSSKSHLALRISFFVSRILAPATRPMLRHTRVLLYGVLPYLQLFDLLPKSGPGRRRQELQADQQGHYEVLLVRPLDPPG
jgi:hypothetical protein